jgi:deoxyribose-phosphate aldolase
MRRFVASASEKQLSMFRNLAAYIDHTLLRPEASERRIIAMCAEARYFGFAAMCVNTAWVAVCVAELRDTPVKVCATVGFPLGACSSTVKLFETEEALKLGADEIDMVMAIGALKEQRDEAVRREVAAIAELSHAAGAHTKVILETAVLSDEEKTRACRLAMKAGADFVKTSTGFGPAGANPHDVELMRAVVGDRMGVKAAGGIRNLQEALALIEAGASRLGTSASVSIMEEAAAQLSRESHQARSVGL